VKVLITALALFLVAMAAAAENPSPLYLVVMEPGGGPPPDVAGGTVECQQGEMLALRLPEQAVEGLRHNPRVRYIQRVVSASEEVQAPVRTVETTGDLRPRTEMASPWTTGTYSYDGSGNITSIGPNSDAKTNVYRYDTIGRLSTATIHTPSTPSSAAVAHSESYGYDRYGNRTGITTDGVPIALPADAATNRLVASLGVTYDAVGNVKSDPSGSNHSYDAANMLRQRGGTAYLYTADDERIATVSGTSGARWTLRNLEGKVVREYDSFGPTTGMEYFLWTEDFFHAGSQLVASQRETAEGGRRHYHLDHLGTPLFATNASGSRVSSHAYYPFGVEATSILQERNRGFDREQPLRYTGHERDGLDSSIAEHDDYVDYMHARYYRAGWGRFLSVDPKSVYEPRKLPQGWNRYAYAMNNPVKFLDPDGEETKLAVGLRTDQNPVGHLAIVINDKAYSFGTNWSNRGANQQDWGASAQVYLDAQNGHRQTQLMTLDITPEQEHKLQQHLDANNPNAPGAPKYGEISNSCVTVTYNALTQTGTLPNVPIQQSSGMLVMSHVGAVTPAEAASNVQQTGFVKSTATVGTEPKVGFWRSVWNAVSERF